MKVAICYWGLTRTLNKTYKSHKKHIYNILKNNNIDYDIYIHTWDLEDEFEYIWLKKINKISNLNDIELLNPYSYKIDKQKEFLKQLDFSKYFYEKEWKGKPPRTNNQKGEWYPQLLRNHLCALESLNRCYELVKNSNEIYDYIICIRPDGLLNKDINIKYITDTENNEIAVPKNEEYNGYCDRFAIGNPKLMEYYMCRIKEAPIFRKKKHRIDAESLCKYIIDKYAKVKKISYNYDKILRK